MFNILFAIHLSSIHKGLCDLELRVLLLKLKTLHFPQFYDFLFGLSLCSLVHLKNSFL
jgi:hypothetical protein